MGPVTLNDIIVTPLNRIPTSGGDVMLAMKAVDAGYAGFGEAYFSCIAKGAIKAWKCHSLMTINLVVPLGYVRFVFYDNNGKTFRVEDIGNERFVRLSVPPGIWFGFRGLTEPQSIILNIASILHDPNEVQRLPTDGIIHDWS